MQKKYFELLNEFQSFHCLLFFGAIKQSIFGERAQVWPPHFVQQLGRMPKALLSPQTYISRYFHVIVGPTMTMSVLK